VITCPNCGQSIVVDSDEDNRSEGRRDFTAAQLESLGKAGKALWLDRHWAFPTPTRGDNDNAVKSVGRTPGKNRATVRRYLIQRARQEDWPIPPSWQSDGTLGGARMGQPDVLSRDACGGPGAPASVSAITDIAAGWHLPGDACPVALSAHATEQASRRCFRRLDLDAVRHELSAGLAGAIVYREPPAWLRRSDRQRHHPAWLVYEDQRLALPPDASFTAPTALTATDGAPVGATVHWRT
jgi:hypothetical protein